MRRCSRALPPRARPTGARIACVVWSTVAATALLGCAPRPQRPWECLGPWAVGYRRATAVDARRGNRTLPMGIWYPVEPAQAAGKRAAYVCFEHPLLTLAVRSDKAVRDAPISTARKWPLVVFSHGTPSLETQSPNYVETLASWGFVVVGVRHVGSTIFEKHPDLPLPAPASDAAAPVAGAQGEANGSGAASDTSRTIAAARRGEAWAVDLTGKTALGGLYRPFDVWFTIDWVAKQAADPSSFLHGLVDTARVGVTGHSAGGCTTLAAAAGYSGGPPDPRIKGIVVIATAATAMIPDKTLQTITAPALFLTGDRDTRAPWERETLRACKLVASRPVAIVKIRDAGHTHFADIDGFAHRLKSLGLYPWTWRSVGAGRLVRAYRESHAEGLLPPYTAQRILDKYAVAFFRRHLCGEREGTEILTAAPTRGEEPAVELLLPPFAPSGEGRAANPR